MILRKTYTITDWKFWDRQLDSAAKEFFAVTGKWPNILLANDPTLGRIDFLANQARQNIFPGDGHVPKLSQTDEGAFRVLSGFQGASYSIEFCMDPHLVSESFSLIFDSDPDGDDGEPVPKEDNVKVKLRKSTKSRKAS